MAHMSCFNPGYTVCGFELTLDIHMYVVKLCTQLACTLYQLLIVYNFCYMYVMETTWYNKGVYIYIHVYSVHTCMVEQVHVHVHVGLC